jgi:uncharacterized protein YciI
VPFFVVEAGNGPGYDPARGRREQPLWDEHAAFMDRLVEEGFVVLGGPLGRDGDTVLLVVEAADEAAVRARLDEDPWAPLQVLTHERIEPWTLWLDGRGVNGV